MKPWQHIDYAPYFWQLAQVLLFMLLYALYHQAFAGKDSKLDSKESVQHGFFIILLLIFTGQPSLMTETVVLTLIVCVTGERMLNSNLFTALLNRPNQDVSKNYPGIDTGAVPGAAGTDLQVGDEAGLPYDNEPGQPANHPDRYPLSAS